jgi:hypothetical protein
MLKPNELSEWFVQRCMRVADAAPADVMGFVDELQSTIPSHIQSNGANTTITGSAWQQGVGGRCCRFFSTSSSASYFSLDATASAAASVGSTVYIRRASPSPPSVGASARSMAGGVGVSSGGYSAGWSRSMGPACEETAYLLEGCGGLPLPASECELAAGLLGSCSNTTDPDEYDDDDNATSVGGAQDTQGEAAVAHSSDTTCTNDVPM